MLVVSPHAADRLLLTQMLERSGRASEAVATAADAIGALAADRCALLLVDADTPDLDGLLAAARAHDLPVALMSARGTNDPRGTVALAKPIRQTALATTIAALLDGSRATTAARPRVLLADDDPVSRELAAEHLGRLGYAVLVAGSAAEAWARWRAEPVDLVMLDVLLPDMSGLELTAHIRAHEHATGARRVPIVALTGRATAGDQERCLAAGMDGHIAKPLVADTLAGTLAEVAGGAAATRPVAVAVPPMGALDAERLLATVHGDMTFLRRLIALFREQSAQLLRAGWRAIERGDAGGLDGAAHALRSVVGHFSTGAVFELAGTVETMARAANVAAASVRWRELEGMIARLGRALDALDPGASSGQDVS